MKRIAQLAIAALAIAGTARAATAQDPAPDDQPFFGRPAFMVMPGVVMTPVLDGDKGDTKTYFNARFMTVIPTSLPWLQGVAGVQWQPNSPRVGGQRQNLPGVFWGGIIPFVPLNNATNGWLSFSLDPLGVYSPGGGGNPDENAYGHDFFLEGAMVVNIGQKMMTNMPMFSRTSAYFLLDQALTNRPDDDFWGPVALMGIIIPIGQ